MTTGGLHPPVCRAARVAIISAAASASDERRFASVRTHLPLIKALYKALYRPSSIIPMVVLTGEIIVFIVSVLTRSTVLIELI